MKKVTTEPFIKESKNIHSKYDYSKVIYKSSKEKVCIICSEHGEFWQAPSDHLKGRGCPKCGRILHEKSRRSTTEEFIKKAKLVHKDLYTYEFVEYKNARSSVKIICKIHGIFEQNAANHLNGQGCPICKSSKGELLIHNWLKDNNIPFKSQFELITSEIARNTNLIIVDFFVKYKDKQYFIEFDGKQHFEYVPYFHKSEEDFEKQQIRDDILNNFCELHKDKVTLIRFNYKQTKEEIVRSLINIF